MGFKGVDRSHLAQVRM